MISIGITVKGRPSPIAYYSERELEELREDSHHSIVTVQMDVRNENDVKMLFEKAEAAFGRVDILVANAGIAPRQAFVHEMNLKQWESTLSVLNVIRKLVILEQKKEKT